MISFLRQIKYEIKNILRSKFLLILGILFLAAAIVSPIISLISSRRPSNSYDDNIIVYEKSAVGRPIYPDYNQEPIIVDGVTIDENNPLYWNITSLYSEMDYMEKDKERFSSPEALDLALSLMDTELQYYLHFAKYITNYSDYRMDLSYRSMQSLYDKFIFENIDVQEDVLLEAVNQRLGFDSETFKNKYLDLTPEARLAALDKADEELNSLFDIVETNNFAKYVDLRIAQENNSISDMKDNIILYEQEIIKDPSQEEFYNSMIEEMNRSIALIEENTIPILKLRLEKNIVPGDDVWQNNALASLENYRNQLSYTQIISEEEFSQAPWLVQQYKTYRKYAAEMQKQIDEINNYIIIAEKSINADKPDMRFKQDGSRNRTFQFLNYSIFAALFAALLGGWIMASEFQQGTIRLLMIRPKTRTKILMAKFFSALIFCLGIYIAGSLINTITNGFCFGFLDYAFPNYTVSGEINFFAYYLPKMLACMVPIIFIFSIAFMLSVIAKNVAVSIAVPIASYIGSLILTTAFTYGNSARWLAYTPMPYMQLSTFFTQYGANRYVGMYGNTMTLNLSYGILLLLALSAVCTILSIFVFKKRDIVN